MMQGDEYYIPLSIEVEDTIVSPNTFDDLEFSFGKIRKTLKDGQIEYSEETGDFNIYLTQEETFTLKKSEKMQIRCKFKNGEVVGVDIGSYKVIQSTSKVVL